MAFLLLPAAIAAAYLGHLVPSILAAGVRACAWLWHEVNR